MEFFKASRGLCEGCPLSPLLFVLQASIMSFYLEKCQVDQEFMDLRIAGGVKDINHTLFIDDSLLLGASSTYSTSKFREVLDDFCGISGSKLNEGKCHFYG